MLLALHNVKGVVHIALICSATFNFYQVHFKNEQSQVFLPDSHVTIGMIQKIQDAANLLRALSISTQ